MYGIGYISPSVNTLLSKSPKLATLGKLPPMDSPSGNAFEIDYVPLSQIFTDEKNFQNRADKYSEKSVKSIINAVENDAFNWFAFDPVTLWLNPSDGKYYVLSGHSRTQAFRELSNRRPRPIVDGLSFDRIPAKIFKGSFDDAKYLALNSNTLGTPETLTERADYYRTQRTMADAAELKNLKKKALRENNGQLIWDLSYLPADGMTMQSLKSFKVDGQDSMENFVRLATIAQWIGKAFQIYRGLSTAHDQELLKFLLNGGYGSKSGQYFSFSALNDRLEKLYKKNVADPDKVNRKGEYTNPFQIAAYSKSDEDLDEINDLKKVADNALKDLKKSLKNLRDNNADRETIYKVATPYFNGWANALYDWWQVLDRVPVKDSAPSLFGLGKPTIKFEFEDNAAIADFLKDMQRQWRFSNFADFEDVTANAANAKANAPKSKIRNGRLMPAADSAYLPESPAPSALPPSPTSPTLPPSPSSTAKALPPYVDVKNGIAPIEVSEQFKFIGLKGELPYREVYLPNYLSLREWWNWADEQYKKTYGDTISFVEIDEPKHKYKFYFRSEDKQKILPYLLNPTDYEEMSGHVIIRNVRDMARIFSGLDNGQSVLTILHPRLVSQKTKDSTIPTSGETVKFSHVKKDGLGKPTIKLEFEDNADLMSLFDTDGISGLTVNDRPAAVFNCPESQLDTRGYRPTYRRLANYDHLVDPADGCKTLKGYGFEKSTLDELINACKCYPQVARLAAHLKDPAGDPLQSAFNIWHWLHTNVRYDYDKPGEEEIRTPARSYADRHSGIDCDCLAVLTACLLINQGFHPCFEIVGFNNEPQYSHIYVNLDGAAIDRVLPVFLARPQGITKTKIMEIPVYALSGVGGCDTLSGVYSSTLTKIHQGTATPEDNNNFRKTQVLVTLRGIDQAAYKLAALLMPYVTTVGDDGAYYFDNKSISDLAARFGKELTDLQTSNATDAQINLWLNQVANELAAAANVATVDTEDTIVVIINPKGDLTRIVGNMQRTDIPTLSDRTHNAVATSSPYLATNTPAVTQTTPRPTVAPEGDGEAEGSGWWKYALAAVAGLGIGAMVVGKTKTNKRK